VKKEGDSKTGEEEEREYRFLKYYWVLNIEQIEGISWEAVIQIGWYLIFSS
jgi:antirestriction protein ArdC